MIVQTKSRAIGRAFMVPTAIFLLHAVILAFIITFALPFVGGGWAWTPTWPRQLWIHGSLLTLSIVCFVVSPTGRLVDITQRDIGNALFFLVPTVIGGIVAILIAYPLLLYISVYVGFFFHQLKEEWGIVGITIPGPPPTAPDLHPRISAGPINRREYYKSKM